MILSLGEQRRQEQRLIRHLQMLPDLVARSVGPSLFAGAQVVERKLETSVPVGTVNNPNQAKLKDSTASYRRPRRMFGRRYPKGAAVVGVWEPHAVFVEFGTVHQPPQAFFRRTVATAASQVDSTVVARLRRAVRTFRRF